jgi:hypothetical protein
MGLAISVGLLADLVENDPDGVEWMEENLKIVNRVLHTANLRPHSEPRELQPPAGRCSIAGFPYSFIHYLRRAFAYQTTDASWLAAPLPDGVDPTEDPVLGAVTEQLTSHLLCHSDCEGFYVPVDFADVLFDEEDKLPGGMLGSSYRLLAELKAVAPAIGIQIKGGELTDEEAQRVDAIACSEEGLWRECCVWLALYEAARISVEEKTMIAFT